jgi:thioredoxin-related protein
MTKLPYPLMIVINRFGFLSVPAPIVLILALGLGINGYTLVDGLILAVVVIGFVGLWWRFHARQSDNVPENTETLLDTINQNGKYAMLAFCTEFCLSSTNVNHRLAELEKAHPEKFQMYTVSVLKDPGKDLFKHFEGRVTPTYVLLDPNGKELMNWPLVLPVDRVTYAVQQGIPAVKAAV